MPNHRHNNLFQISKVMAIQKQNFLEEGGEETSIVNMVKADRSDVDNCQVIDNLTDTEEFDQFLAADDQQ